MSKRPEKQFKSAIGLFKSKFPEFKLLRKDDILSDPIASVAFETSSSEYNKMNSEYMAQMEQWILENPSQNLDDKQFRKIKQKIIQNQEKPVKRRKKRGGSPVFDEPLDDLQKVLVVSRNIQSEISKLETAFNTIKRFQENINKQIEDLRQTNELNLVFDVTALGETPVTKEEEEQSESESESESEEEQPSPFFNSESDSEEEEED